MRRGAAHSPLPTAPTLETVMVPPRRGMSAGVRPLGVDRPRTCRRRSSPMISYADFVSTAPMVGVYNPLGVDRAMEISA